MPSSARGGLLLGVERRGDWLGILLPHCCSVAEWHGHSIELNTQEGAEWCRPFHLVLCQRTSSSRQVANVVHNAIAHLFELGWPSRRKSSRWWMTWCTSLDFRIHSSASAKALKMAGVVARPNGSWQSTYTEPCHGTPKKQRSSGWIGTNLYPFCISILTRSAPGPKKCMSIAASSMEA